MSSHCLKRSTILPMTSFLRTETEQCKDKSWPEIQRSNQEHPSYTLSLFTSSCKNYVLKALNVKIMGDLSMLIKTEMPYIIHRVFKVNALSSLTWRRLSQGSGTGRRVPVDLWRLRYQRLNNVSRNLSDN